MKYEKEQEQFVLSTDSKLLDVILIHQYLSVESYWAKNIPLATVQQSIEGSLCFGIYQKQPAHAQVGFARVVTDKATFAYLADVFILPPFRGRGLSKWMMECIMAHPQLQGLRKWMLGTKDAHGLYSQFGFRPLDNPERTMGYAPFITYPETQ